MLALLNPCKRGANSPKRPFYDDSLITQDKRPELLNACITMLATVEPMVTHYKKAPPFGVGFECLALDPSRKEPLYDEY